MQPKNLAGFLPLESDFLLKNKVTDEQMFKFFNQTLQYNYSFKKERISFTQKVKKTFCSLFIIDQQCLHRFIKAFGTHYISKSTMGALFGEQSMFDSESWSEMVSNGVDINLAAGFSAIANINASLNYNNTETETFKRFSKEQLIYSRGAVPPADGKPLTWAQSSIEEPNVLSITLEPLDSLPIDEYVSAQGT